MRSLLRSLTRFTKLSSFIYREKTVFTQVLNPMTGQNEWRVHEKDEEYDYQQEIANAGFGDMLHDTERNQKYYEALRKIIKRLHGEGRQAHVLDIGTGTGILSMMAVQAGADSVTACEAFRPMADCAERIFKSNGFADRVRLIKRRSTAIRVGDGPGDDMSTRANVLVTEVLDTELIGEGAISIYNHAHACLLTDDVVCIPARAICYAQVAESPMAAQWNTLKLLPNLDGEVLLQPPAEVLACKGEAALHDVQLSQLPAHLFRPLTEPRQIFEFDFTSKMSREATRSHNLVMSSLGGGGSTDVVFYWWRIDMDADSEIQLSCAPVWAHPEAGEREGRIPWRDHWMQAIYYVPKPLQLQEAAAEFVLSCNHDEYSLWFDVTEQEDVAGNSLEAFRPSRHACTCCLHMTYSRSRIGQMNQAVRQKRFMGFLEKSVSDKSHVLCFGDGCTVGLAAAKLGAAGVICHEPHRYSRRFMEQLSEQNEVKPKVRFIDALSELEPETLATLTHVFAEPFFLKAILPWDNFYFGTLLLKLAEQLPAAAVVAPFGARIYALPVEFADLHKIRIPVGECEGFDLRLFDDMVESSVQATQSKVEAQPLWEYPCRALALPQQILSVKFRQFGEEKANNSASIPLEASGSCNGIALWVDWLIDDRDQPQSVISTGPTGPVTAGAQVQWDMFVRQGVHLFRQPQHVEANGGDSVCWSVEFDPLLGRMEFNFRFGSSAESKSDKQ